MWAESIKLSTYICIIYGRIEFLFHQPWGESCLLGGDVFGTPTARVMFWASVLSWRTDRNAVEAQWSMDSSTEKKLLDSLADTSTGRFFWNTPSSTPRSQVRSLVETTKQKHNQTHTNTNSPKLCQHFTGAPAGMTSLQKSPRVKSNKI